MLHVLAGGLAIVAGFAALALRKGARGHRLTGNLFFVCMLTMAGSAGVLSALALQRLNILVSLLTLYLVLTAWTAVRTPPGRLGGLQILASLPGFAAALIGAVVGWQAATVGIQDGDPPVGNSPIGYFAFGGVAAFAVALDLWVIRRGGVSGAARTARHLWRMCLALAIAAASFFLGQADEIPQALRGQHLAIPPLAVLAAMIFWLVRVRRPNRARTHASRPDRIEEARA
jgi:hypothetical protein